VDSSESSRQETTEEYPEKNIERGDGKVENDLDRNAEESSRSEKDKEDKKEKEKEEKKKKKKKEYC